MDITTRWHPEFLQNKLEWDFLQQSYEGGKEYIFGGNLIKHKLESETSLALRLKRAYYFNYCRPVVDIYNQYIFSSKVTRLFTDSTLKDFNKNADGSGSSMDSVMSVANKFSAIYGISYCSVTTKDIGEEPAVVTRVIKQDPFISNLKPQVIIDWALDDVGEFIWVLIRLNRLIDSDPQTERRTEKVYILWEKDKYTEYSENGTINETHSNILGIVPIVPVTHYTRDSKDELITKGMLCDISRVNKALFNWCSLLDTILYEQAFSILTVQETGAKKDIQQIGTTDAFSYEAGCNQPNFISPDASQGSLFMEWIDRAIEEMYRLACLERSGAVNRSEQPQSGISKAFDFIDTNQAVSSKAQILADVEETLCALKLGWGAVTTGRAPYSSLKELKEEMKGKISITYPQTFDYSAYRADVKEAFEVLKLRISKRFTKEYKKVLAPKLLPNVPVSIIEEIQKEIEEAKDEDEEISVEKDDAATNNETDGKDKEIETS